MQVWPTYTKHKFVPKPFVTPMYAYKYERFKSAARSSQFVCQEMHDNVTVHTSKPVSMLKS